MRTACSPSQHVRQCAPFFLCLHISCYCGLWTLRGVLPQEPFIWDLQGVFDYMVNLQPMFQHSSFFFFGGGGFRRLRRGATCETTWQRTKESQRYSYVKLSILILNLHQVPTGGTKDLVQEATVMLQPRT